MNYPLHGLILGLAMTVAPASAQDGRSSESDLVFEVPAPGCPQEFPTYSSVRSFCNKLDARTCKASLRCSWSGAWRGKSGAEYPAECGPKSGTYLSPGSTDPAETTTLLPALMLAISEQGTKLANSGYSAAAIKQYDRAISLYTQALKFDAEHSQIHVMRGLVQEYKNDTKRAIADYCTGLAHGTDWQAEQIARERIAQLTQVGVERLPLPKFMNNGVLRARKGQQALAPFKIETPSGSDFLVKLINIKDGAEEILLFVRADSSLQVNIPFGAYKIRGASGATWYGEPHLFGKKTRYFRLVGKNDKDDTFKFARDGNIARGHVVRLIKQKDGNLETPSISPEEF